MSTRADVSTKFGTIALIVTCADHICATTNPGAGRADELLPWVIRGKEYKFITAHLHRWTDGKFHLGEEKHKGNDWAQRCSGLFFTEGTAFAKKLVHAEVERVANEFAEDFPATLDKSEVESLTEQIESEKKHREDLAEQLRTVTNKISELYDKRDRVIGKR